MATDKKMRVAIIGCGSISGNHASAILDCGCEICALCGILPEQATKLAEKFGISAPIYTDYIEMLERETPDSVHICTPHYLHVPMICEVLGRNINVLCEKPLAIDEEGLCAVLAAEEASSATLGVCLQNRYEESMLALRELARGGVSTAAGIMIWDRGEAYYASGEWRGKWATEGGGVMINQALHTLDLFQWIFGMPKFVTAHIANDHLKGVIEVEDMTAALFETEDGRRFNFYATTSASGNLPAQLQAVLSDGRKVFATNDILIVGEEHIERNASTEQPIGKSVWGTGHRKLIADFYRHVSDGKPFPISGKEAAAVIRLILAIYASKGEKIKI